jgi:hypothetical protein
MTLRIGVMTFVLATAALGQQPTRPEPPRMALPPGGAAQAQRRPSAKSAQQQGHRAELRWSPSASRDVTGYYVYRAVGGLGAGFNRITPLPVAGTEFTDLNVEAGKVYVYAVSAVRTGSSGVKESRFTPPVVVRIPSP